MFIKTDVKLEIPLELFNKIKQHFNSLVFVLVTSSKGSILKKITNESGSKN